MPAFSQKIPSKLSSYAPEIDGLRAIAVIGVVLFHLSLGFPGGYVGVDVFFVISGYLITSHILKDLAENRFSLRMFWIRRIRRIVPALAVVITFTFFAGLAFLMPSGLKELGRSMIAQALLVSNIYFWQADKNSGGYFGTTSEDRPLLHTWSLAVEEQFYLIIPIIILFLFSYPRFRNPRALPSLIFLALLGSLSLAAVGTRHFPGATFYLLPGRAWEILCGSLLASLPASWAPTGKASREGLSFIGLISLVLPTVIYSKSTIFPGLAALPPCFGTALIIWCDSVPRNLDQKPTFAARLLSFRPLVFVGLISYSLYLWHWPLLVFSLYRDAGRPAEISQRLAILFCSAVCAWLTWKFVEQPTRCGQQWSTKKAFRFAGTLGLAALIAGLVAATGLTRRFSPGLV